MGLLGVLAILTGVRGGRAARAVPAAAHFDTAFVRANGFMMDSLRLGRPSAPAKAIAPLPLHQTVKPAPSAPDTVPARYSPRGCMPE